MAKYEYILVEKQGDANTRRGPPIRAASGSLDTVRDREIPSAAKHPDHAGAKFYMIKRLEDDADVAEGPLP